MTNDDLDALKARIADLEAALDQKNKSIEATFKLTPSLTNLLGLLLSLPTVSAEIITHRLEVTSDAKVAVHRLRKILLPYGVTIHSTRLLGYWISDEDKEKIRAEIGHARSVSANYEQRAAA